MKYLTLMAIVVLAVSITGCKTLTNRQSGPISVDEYLNYHKNLHSMNDTELASVYEAAQAGYSSSPGPYSRLRLGLIMAHPGHMHSNLTEARAHFLSIVNSDQPLPDNLRDFTHIQLDHTIRLLQKQESFKSHTQKIDSLENKLKKSEKRKKSLRRENEQLKKSLKEANKKIRALTDIEQDLSDVENE